MARWRVPLPYLVLVTAAAAFLGLFLYRPAVTAVFDTNRNGVADPGETNTLSVVMKPVGDTRVDGERRLPEAVLLPAGDPVFRVTSFGVVAGETTDTTAPGVQRTTFTRDAVDYYGNPTGSEIRDSVAYSTRTPGDRDAWAQTVMGLIASDLDMTAGPAPFRPYNRDWIAAGILVSADGGKHPLLIVWTPERAVASIDARNIDRDAPAISPGDYLTITLVRPATGWFTQLNEATSTTERN